MPRSAAGRSAATSGRVGSSEVGVEDSGASRPIDTRQPARRATLLGRDRPRRGAGRLGPARDRRAFRRIGGPRRSTAARRVTVQDCASVEPVSEAGGYRRHAFFTSGQLTLFLGCRSKGGRHDFAVGAMSAGPNAFVDCTAEEALGFSGPIESWASGVLYDNVTVDGGGWPSRIARSTARGSAGPRPTACSGSARRRSITCRRPPGAAQLGDRLLGPVPTATASGSRPTSSSSPRASTRPSSPIGWAPPRSPRSNHAQSSRRSGMPGHWRRSGPDRSRQTRHPCGRWPSATVGSPATRP